MSKDMKSALMAVMYWLSGLFCGFAAYQAFDYYKWQRPLDNCVKAHQRYCFVGKARFEIIYKKK